MRHFPALRVRDYRHWWLALLSMQLGLQMLEVAIGWEVYAQHGRPLDLGWIGLAEFIPMFVLALPAGHLADRLPRRLVFAGALLLGVAVGIGLALLSWSGVTSVLAYLALAAGAGVTMALGNPAARAMAPASRNGTNLPRSAVNNSVACQ